MRDQHASQPSDPSPSLEVMLECKDLCAWYGAAQILFDVNLKVRRGEVVALMGRNGAGKSTTLKSLMGLIAQKTGQVLFLGQDQQGCEPYEAAQKGLAYVPEDRRIFGELTVLENLSVARQGKRRFPDGREAPFWDFERLGVLFPNLAQMPNRLGSHMSGGEQQMLTVARSLMGNPLVLLLDEPSEGVAPLIMEQMGEMILALKRQGVSILLSEQNLHFAKWVSDYVYVLEKGEVKHHASMQDLARDPQALKSYLSV
ncbi:MAG: ABC transporter ATP-binding protein [Betaproteobacteria bacterium]